MRLEFEQFDLARPLARLIWRLVCGLGNLIKVARKSRLIELFKVVAWSTRGRSRLRTYDACFNDISAYICLLDILFDTWT